MKKVLRFTASWCTPCKALAPILEEVETTIPIEVVDVDTEEGSKLATKYGIRGVPTLVMVENDFTIKSMTGLKTKEQLTSWIND